MRLKRMKSEIYRYLVVLSVKNLVALEQILADIQDDEGILLVDLSERMAYKRAYDED